MWYAIIFLARLENVKGRGNDLPVIQHRVQKKLKNRKYDHLEKKAHTNVKVVNVSKKKAADLCTVKMGRTLTYGLHTMKSSIDAVPRTKRSHLTECKN